MTNLMFKRSKSPFYMDDRANISSQYIFDDAYQNVMKKMKFQKNPKFNYFNAIVKMKNKLQNNQHDVYTKVFQYQSKTNDEYGSLPNRMNKTTRAWMEKSSEKQKEQQQKVKKIDIKKFKRNYSHIQDLSFEMISSPRSGEYYNKRPKLDEILAGFRKMGQTGTNFKQRNNTSTPRNYNKIQSLQKQINRHLPSYASTSIKKSYNR